MVKRISIYIITTLFFSACAQVVAPSGGERDLEPPSIIKSTPANGSNQFSGKEIVIEFDEFIVLKNLNDQLLVSPPLKYKLASKVKGKRLILEIKDTLLENTTYVLNFGNSITDLNEGNAISNFQYVFSTGTSIDSLIVSGKIVDAFSLKIEEGVFAFLYPKFESDSVPFATLPSYIGKSDKEGNFQISNIKEGSYSILALKDGNKNYLYDRVTEKIGFLNEPITVDKNRDELLIYSFIPEYEKQYIDKQKVTFIEVELKFKRFPSEFKYEVIDSKSLEVLQLEIHENDIHLWMEETKRKKVKMIVKEGAFIDTIKLELDSIPNGSNLKLKSNLSKSQNYYEPIKLSFSRPIASIDLTKFKILRADSSFINPKIIKDDADIKSLLLSFEFKNEEIYFLRVSPSAVIDIYGKTNDSIEASLSFNKLEDFGNIEVKILTEGNENKIIQLTNSKGIVIEEKIVTDTIINFLNLTPGEYRFKLIFDSNLNGKWDSGDFYKKKQPERTFLYNEDIVVRENWDKQITWIVK